MAVLFPVHFICRNARMRTFVKAQSFWFSFPPEDVLPLSSPLVARLLDKSSAASLNRILLCFATSVAQKSEQELSINLKYRFRWMKKGSFHLKFIRLPLMVANVKQSQQFQISFSKIPKVKNTM